MSTLSPEERALLDEARKGWTASPDVARSVRAGIAERLRADPTFGMDAPGPANGATAARVPIARMFLKSPLAIVSALAVAGACAFFVARRESPPRPPTTSGTSVVPSAPAPPAVTTSPEIGTVAVDSLPSAKATPSASSSKATRKPIASSASHTDTIAEEVALVGAAQRSLRDGSPGDALSTLSTHAARFPGGALREERMALQVLALCELGDLPKARRTRAELEQLAPSSSHLQRLGCAAP